MSTRWYPLYQRGNPQLRVFLPNFWMKLVPNEQPQPPNIVTFHTSMEMTTADMKNYLEKIYKIPVTKIHSRIAMGKFKRQEWRGYIVKNEDYKVAYVTLPREEVFTYPNLFPKDKMEAMKKELKQLDEAKVSYNKLATNNKFRKGVPEGFSL